MASDTFSVRVYMAGDIDHDDQVTVGDLQLLATAWASSANSSNWNQQADLNEDGYINVGDIQILVANWGKRMQ